MSGTNSGSTGQSGDLPRGRGGGGRELWLSMRTGDEEKQRGARKVGKTREEAPRQARHV